MTQEAAAWVVPGDNAREDGSIDAKAWQEGEFTRPLYPTPVDCLAVALLREGERAMGNEERVQWKKRVGAYLAALSRC